MTTKKTTTKKPLTVRKVKGETWITHAATGMRVPVFGELSKQKGKPPAKSKTPVVIKPSELRRLLAERNGAKREAVRWEKLWQVCRGTIAALKSQLYQKEKRIREQDELQSEGPDLRERVFTLERSLREANQRAKMLADRASEAAIQRVAALEAAEALRGQLDDMAARAVEKVKEADEAHCAVGEMRERAEKAEAQVDALNNVRAELLDGRDRLNAECARLVTEWGAAKAQVFVLTNALECKAEAEAQVAALTAERDGARLDLEKAQARVTVLTQEFKAQAAALEESERTVMGLSEEVRVARERLAEVEEHLQVSAKRWQEEKDDLGAALCLARLETKRAREDGSRLALMVEQQVNEFLRQVGALPNCGALTYLTSLLSHAAVAYQLLLVGVLNGLSEAAEGGRDCGGQ